MMVENPDKIEEFKNADEIVTKAESDSLSSWAKAKDPENVTQMDSSSQAPQNDKKTVKKITKKPTSRKKA
jgi:hypothetical protein